MKDPSNRISKRLLPLLLILGILAFFLTAEHRAHAFGILPYVLLLLCPLLHLLHGKHHGGDVHADRDAIHDGQHGRSR